MAKVLVVSAHPDDEVIGVGGTLLKHVASGDEVCWLIITDILSNHGFDELTIKRRSNEIVRIGEMVGFSRIVKFQYPTMTLSSESIVDMVPKLSALMNDFQPEIIYTMNRSDAHSDHRIIFDAVMACTKSFRYPFIRKVLMYETISETEFAPALAEKAFVPNYFVDVSDYFSKKIELAKVYASEFGEHPFPRSIRNLEALAVFRGASCGAEYAEAFQLLKWIDK